MDRAIEKVYQNSKFQDHINNILNKLIQSNINPSKDSIVLANKIMEHCEKNGGRVIVPEVENNVVEVLGKSEKKKRNQQIVIDTVLERLKKKK